MYSYYDLPLSALSPYLVPASLSILFSLVICRAVYLLFFSPLSAIPGPWYAAISNVWITYHVVRLEQCKTVQKLFEKYGPVVRIGPNKVVFRDLASTRSVYSHHKFDKSTYYKSLLTNDNDHAMTTLEHASHSMRRKAYAPHYNPTHLALYQPEIHEAVLEMLEKLDAIAGFQPVECLRLFRHLAVDIVVNSSYGYRPGSINKWASNVEDRLSTAISDFPKRGILRSIVPTWAWKLVCRFPNLRWRQLCDSDKIMAEFVSSQVQGMRTDIAAGKLHVDSDKKPLLQRLLTHRYPTNEPMPDTHIISEAMGHM
jgi:cytochrome P450